MPTNVDLANHSLRNMMNAAEKLKLAIKSTPAIPVPKQRSPPEVIIIDDEEVETSVVISPPNPCRREQNQAANGQEVIIID